MAAHSEEPGEGLRNKEVKKGGEGAALTHASLKGDQCRDMAIDIRRRRGYMHYPGTPGVTAPRSTGLTGGTKSKKGRQQEVPLWGGIQKAHELKRSVRKDTKDSRKLLASPSRWLEAPQARK